ncbi:MAG: response regulator transcription factor, partial [Bacteroidales bacterium]|nr:response regulator transcription factor [Bacteroidales bacterium]
MKILVVDDHKMFREGLKMILSNVDFISQVDDAGSGPEFLEKINQNLPDIVLMDIMMPDMDGMQATEIAMVKYPDLKIIALSSYGEEYYYYRMTKAGVRGFVQKNTGIEELTTAIEEVANGECYFSKEILRNIIV